MADLIFTEKTTRFVEYNDLEEFIKSSFGFAYDIVANEECGNDAVLSFEVTEEVDEHDFEDFAKLRNNQYVPYRTHMLLNMLARCGFITTGSYVVTVCW